MEVRSFTVSRCEPIAKSVFRLELFSDTPFEAHPGQFVNLSIPGLYLRRPISVCDVEENRLTLVFKVVGKGTALLAAAEPGRKLELLTGLGNGYDLSASGDKPLLLGGGVGVPPLYYLAKRLRGQGKVVSVVLGFNTREEVFFEESFLSLGCRVTVTTVDGSYGVKGFVTDALPVEYSYFYTCGPEPMLRAVFKRTSTDGEFSFEERMGCGFGACMGCSQKTAAGYKRVCKDGPVFRKGEILWED